MKKESKYNAVWPIIGLSFSLALPSTNQVQKYLRTTAVFLYIPMVFLAILVIYKYCIKWFLSRVTEKQVYRLAAVTLIILIAVFFIVYPIANSGIVGGGCDRDEDANIATMELLRGRYPYYSKTYLGHSPSHLPGSLLLSIPFVLLGNSAYQNFFWLIIFILIAKSYLRDGRLAILLLWTILLLSPVVLQEFVTGGDLLSNSIYILFFILFMVNSVLEPTIKEWKKVLSAVLLGIGLSSRLNYILLLPLVFSVLAQNSDWKSAVKYISLTCFIFLAITLPFYLYNPKDFSALHGQYYKLSQFHNLLPFSGILVPLAGGILALVFSFQRMKRDCITLFRNCMFIQAFLILCAIVLETLQEGKLNLNATAYGFSFLFFGALVLWYKLSKCLYISNKNSS